MFFAAAAEHVIAEKAASTAETSMKKSTRNLSVDVARSEETKQHGKRTPSHLQLVCRRLVGNAPVPHNQVLHHGRKLSVH